ncbi:MAG: hypothetical protein ACOCMW_00310 [Campylobacter hyointestinalis]
MSPSRLSIETARLFSSSFTMSRASCHRLEILAKNVAKNIKFKTQIKSTKTFIGGGSLPNTPYPSVALAFLGNANSFEQEFRQKGIIGRIEEGKFILDFRSIYEDEIPNLINKINEVNGE